MLSKSAVLVSAAAAAAAATYFLDPSQGNRRRAMARDRSAALLRRGSRQVEGAARGASAEVLGATQKAAAAVREGESPPNDQALVAKVETEIFRAASVPKGKINVDAADGVVALRGEVPERDLIDELEKATRKVAGVKDVNNLLHLPDEPAPNVASVSEAGSS